MDNASHIVCFSRRGDKSYLRIAGMDNEGVIKAARNTFRGRFKKPAQVSRKDGTFIRIEDGKLAIFRATVYNKSPRQAMCEFEKAIRAL